MRKPATSSRSPAKSAGIRDIAEALGISIGTVDRALHNRARISPRTREQVLEMAQRLGYRPNLAARYLKSRKEIRIAACLPREVASFFEPLRQGVLDAARPFEASGVRVVLHEYPRLGQGEREAVRRALREEIDGLLIAPGDPEMLTPLLQDAHARGIPVVCVATDAPGAARLATVSVDPVTSGGLVGDLMGRFLRGTGKIFLVTGLLATADHAGKLEGFRSTLRRIWPDLRIMAVVEAHDVEEEAYGKCRALLRKHPDIAGLYVSTANSLPVLRAVEDLRLGEGLTIITTDLFPALTPYLASGRVAATLHQRARTQGQVAFQTLHRHLVDGIAPPAPYVRLSPHVVMRGNLPLFLEQMESEGRLAGDGGTLNVSRARRTPGP